MTGPFAILIPLSLALVLIALGVGLFALFRGGDFGRSWSNKMMRLRVLAQFIAILVLVAVLAAGMTSAPKQGWWEESMSGGTLKQVALTLKPWLPDLFAQRLRYD